MIGGYRIAFIHALRDLRGGMRHFLMLFICLALAVAVITCISTIITSIKGGIENDAKALLGGDIEIRQLYRPLPVEVTSYMMFSGGTMSRTADMRVMAEGKDDRNIDKRALVELKGVDNQYPLYGELELIRGKQRDVFFSDWRGKIHGAAVDQGLLDALDIQLGEMFVIGNTTFRVTAIIAHEPDRSISSFSLGPRVMTNMGAFKSTGLVTETSMVNYRYRLQLPPEVDVRQWKERMVEYFPGSYWGIRDWHDNNSGLSRQVDRLSLFFVLTAITTLIVAGIGISNATSSYMWGKRRTIAAMKCLGASQAHIRRMYLIEICIVSVIAIIYGLFLGLDAKILLLRFLNDIMPVHGTHDIQPEPLLISAALGFITVLLFTLMPLQTSRNIRPAALFRGYVDAEPQGNRGSIASKLLNYTIYVLLAATMVALAIQLTNNTRIPLFFAGGLIGSLLVLYFISIVVKRFARSVAQSGKGSFTTNIAFANLSRPGSATTSIIIALGIGMCVLTTLSLVSSNMRSQLERSLPEKAPAFFMLEVQPSDVEKLTASLKAIEGVQGVDTMPIIRGRITKLKGTLADDAEVEESVRWALRGERGLTVAATPPEKSVLTEGKWWAPDYKGEPLVSFDEALARGMGLKVGDTITITAIDKEITATIANLRDIPWGSLEMNFTTIFSPGALDGLPVTNLVTVTAPPSTEKAIARMMANEYPAVALIRVRDALSNVSAIVSKLSLAIHITASIAILCGTLVMASAIHATLFKRKFETVMMKVIGMTRRQIMAIYLKEFSIAALVTAIIASVIGALAAYGVMQLMVFSYFTLMPNTIIMTLVGSLVIATLLGFFATRATLKVKPLSLLRNE
jgi:putative ABC transport system permease protein